MTLKTWLKFVEIQSLVASVLPLVLGNLYAAITYQHMNAVLAIVFDRRICLADGSECLEQFAGL